MSMIEDSVAQKILKRAELGLNKYGVTMERTDLSTVDWINHAQQEAMDLAVYLERYLQVLESIDIDILERILQDEAFHKKLLQFIEEFKKER